MNRIQRSVVRLMSALVLVLILAGTFAWYFRADLMVDLAAWWAACVRL
ncbi:MAG TPA: hypothetical protein H9903_03700 [Candidatus Aquabacterium excrementipullorum]|nr:hypothetical protein [Candidatus Aquabacterium excrementipullorum]